MFAAFQASYVMPSVASSKSKETKQLRKEGYLQTAKTVALRKLYQEKKVIERENR
jgi:hypothetical protein